MTAQTGSLTGSVSDANSNESLPGVNVIVKNGEKIIFDGISKNESNDSNDHLTFMLQKGETFIFQTQSHQLNHTVEDEDIIDFIIN